MKDIIDWNRNKPQFYDIYKNDIEKKSEIKMNVLCNLDSTVFIINRYPPQTSIYRVTQHLLSVLGDNSTEVDLWFTPKDAKEINSGVGFAGKFSKLPLLNNLFPNFAFSDARKYIKRKERDAGRVMVHYSNQFSGVPTLTSLKSSPSLSITFFTMGKFFLGNPVETESISF